MKMKPTKKVFLKVYNRELSQEKDIPAEPYKMDYGEQGIFTFCLTCGELIAESKHSRCPNCGQMLK